MAGKSTFVVVVDLVVVVDFVVVVVVNVLSEEAIQRNERIL